MNKIVIILLVFVSGIAFAEKLCPTINSRGEGHWPIPEEVFMKINAEKAAKRIQEIVANPNHVDIQAVGPDCALRNQSIIIKGYLLKTDLKNYKNTKYYEKNVEWFCNFLRNEASTCH